MSVIVYACWKIVSITTYTIELLFISSLLHFYFSLCHLMAGGVPKPGNFREAFAHSD